MVTRQTYKAMGLSLLSIQVATALAGCGESRADYFSNGSPNTPTGTVLVQHTLFPAVPGRVDEKVFTGRDASGQVTYGPVIHPKASMIRLENVPVSMTELKIQYLDRDPEPDVEIGVHSSLIELSAGQTLSLTDPAIDLSVAVTTLDQTIEITNPDDRYKRLRNGPGWPTVVREDLAAAMQGRETKRQALMSVAHVSDVHLADSESPLRVEFLRSMQGLELSTDTFQGAWRPQETLLTQVAEAMVRQLNSVAAGPVTGRPYDFAISTGDNSDNRHQNELERFITTLDGGLITPSSGDPDLYEGVQDYTSYSDQYWHPEADPQEGRVDIYKSEYGFPDYPGLLQSAVVPFQASGLSVPWYSVFGNHDYLLQGNFVTKSDIPPANAVEAIATSGRKITALPFFYELLELVEKGSGVDLFLAEWLDPYNLSGSWAQFVSRWHSSLTPSRTVTPDAKRHIYSRREFIQAHLDSPASPGPAGHGFSADNIANDTLYYTFEPVAGVRGITLDTVNPGGNSSGSIDQAQIAWLEARLREVHSRYYDAQGNLVRTGHEDKLVVLFSHHTLETLTNILPDPNDPEHPRVNAAAFETLLHRYPNVVMWMNGHSHICRVFPHPDSSGRTGGFWEVNTPSHIDFPQQSRVVELADNQDGTLSIFATLIDHAGPAQASGAVSSDVLNLASISRELSANDPQIDRNFQLGEAGDRNVELLIKAPFSQAERVEVSGSGQARPSAD